MQVAHITSTRSAAVLIGNSNTGSFPIKLYFHTLLASKSSGLDHFVSLFPSLYNPGNRAIPSQLCCDNNLSVTNMHRLRSFVRNDMALNLNDKLLKYTYTGS